jgi:HD superfamily phosphohydrolase/tRNA A-37 threonylcarbamoyl transferase component Bud32
MSIKGKIKNPIFRRILESINNGTNDPILNFSEYRIIESPGQGQQGLVLRVSNQINKELAIKFYCPSDTNPILLRQGVARFKEEVEKTAKLNHKNLVKIYTGGTAIWSKNVWSISYGFDKSKKLKKDQVMFYIMEYINGTDLSKIFSCFSKVNTTPILQLTKNQKRRFFENLIKHACKGISSYNKLEIFHRDLKPENIRYSKDDENFIIVDFGFAEQIQSQDKTKKELIEITKIIDWYSIDQGVYRKYDMGQFSLLLEIILESIKDCYDNNRYEGLKAVIERGYYPNLEVRFKDMDEFYSAAKAYFIETVGWSFQPILNQSLTEGVFGIFKGYITIPVSKQVLINKELIKIIDTPAFQRLRGVNQLGPTSFVYPGANHTRFEHSLGVYNFSLKYLERLVPTVEFRKVAIPMDKTIKRIVLSCLLHDIGHYPYSHWIEELESNLPYNIKINKHEIRAREIIENTEIKDLIVQDWDIDYNDISSIISDKSTDFQIARSFIDSIVDCDKLDYLIRDSIHCGVNYGNGIDLNRLLTSIYVDIDQEKLCLTDKGKCYLQSMLACRNIMYQEVYWHKTVRACEAMFKRFFYEFISNYYNPRKNTALDSDNQPIDLIKLFEKSDQEFISTMYSYLGEGNDLEKLIKPFSNKGRNLFKPLLIYFQNEKFEHRNGINSFCEKLILDTKNYGDLVNWSDKVTKAFKDKFGKKVRKYDFLVETTPAKGSNEQSDISNFKIWNTRQSNWGNIPGQIKQLNDYLTNNRKAFIFCRSELYDIIKNDFGLLNDILLDVIRNN